MLRRVCLFILIAWLHEAALAQPLRLPVRIFTADDGLGGATITSLAKDSRGFLWIGTPDELLLYDGHSFRPFRYRDSAMSNATAPFRRAVTLQAGRDTFLILHEGGAHQYAATSGLLQPLRLPSSSSEAATYAALTPDARPGWYSFSSALTEARYYPATRRWTDVTSFPLQRMVADVRGDAVYRLRGDTSAGGRTLRFLQPLTARALDSCSAPFRILSALRLPTGFLLLDGASPQHLYWARRGSAPLPVATFSSPVYELHATGIGQDIYLSANSRLMRFNAATKRLVEILDEAGNPLVTKGVITHFLHDGRTLWLGTNASGLLRLSLEGTRFRHLHAPTPAHNFINAIFPDLAHGRIYTGAYAGSFAEYDSAGTFLRDLTPLMRQPGRGLSGYYNHIERLEDGALLIIGSTQYARLYYPERGTVRFLDAGIKASLEKFGLPVYNQPGRRSVYRTGAGEWWMTAGHGLARWRLSGSGNERRLELQQHIPLPGAHPEGITWYNNSLWCATAGMLYRMGPAGAADSFSLPLKSLVTCLQPDKQGRLWIATESGVMLWRDGRTERTITTENRLPNNHVYALLPDSAGWMWGSTNGGLFAVRTDDFRIRSFTSGEGLQGAEFNSGAAATDAQGRFYFGGMNGVNVFYPADALREDVAGRVTITRIAAPDTVYYTYPGASVPPRLQLPHDRANVQLAFTCGQPSSPDLRQYEYRLRDADSLWTDNGNSDELQLYLAPGLYHILVRLHGVPASVADVWVNVAPPFYRRAWFMLLMIALTGIAIAGVFITAARTRYRRRLSVLETTRRIQEEKERISRELHDELGARAALIAHNAGLLADAAKRSGDTTLFTDRIAETTADMLTALRETVWTLKQEGVTAESLWLRYKNFISKLDATYTRIRFVVEEEALPAEPLDYARALSLLRILQEASMNAVKHGNASLITVTAAPTPAGLLFEVADNGRGFDVEAVRASGEGNGLHNMAQRSREAGLRLSIGRRDAGGTVVKILMQEP